MLFVVPTEIIVVKQKKILAWLEKKGEQKPVKWSKNDELMVDGLLKYFISIKDTSESEFFFVLGVDNLISWLESIKDRIQHQSLWKPSDGQMKCISDVVADAKYKNDISTNGYEPYTHLSTLLQQLKKLKG